MNVINMKFGNVQDDDRAEEALRVSLNVHDQMLSCLGFVIEKASHFGTGHISLEPLVLAMTEISDQKEQLVHEFRARDRNGQSRSARNIG